MDALSFEPRVGTAHKDFGGPAGAASSQTTVTLAQQLHRAYQSIELHHPAVEQQDSSLVCTQRQHGRFLRGSCRL